MSLKKVIVIGHSMHSSSIAAAILLLGKDVMVVDKFEEIERERGIELEFKNFDKEFVAKLPYHDDSEVKYQKEQEKLRRKYSNKFKR